MLTGSTGPSLSVTVVGQTIPAGTSTITLGFSIGYGGNTAPTGTPSLTVNGSSTGVGTVSCTAKGGHKNCTATYDPSTLAAGTYTIKATQPADIIYTTASSGTATLTVTGASGSHIASPVRVSLPVTVVPASIANSVPAVAAVNSPAYAAAPVAVSAPAVANPVLAQPMVLYAPVLLVPVLDTDATSDTTSTDPASTGKSNRKAPSPDTNF